jgi:hypothetical protein
MCRLSAVQTREADVVWVDGVADVDVIVEGVAVLVIIVTGQWESLLSLM